MDKLQNQEQLEEALRAGDLECHAKPVRIWLETTSRCNLRCITCPRSYLPFFKGKDIDSEVLDIVMGELFPYAERVIPQGFGEPMISARFEDVFEAAIENGARFSFTTNGMLLSEIWLRRFLERDIRFGLSLDGAREATLKAIRPGIDFARIIRSVELFNRLKATEYVDSQAAIYIMFVGLYSNIQELPELVSLAGELHISEVRVQQFAPSIHPPNVRRQSLRNHKLLAHEFMMLAKTRAEALGVNLEASAYERWKEKEEAEPADEVRPWVQKCFSPWEAILIRTNGDVTPCCASAEIMGNLKSDGFWDVWNGRKYRLWRARIHSPRPPLDCRNCTRLWGINAGNPDNRTARHTLRQEFVYALEHTAKLLGYVRPYLTDYI